MRTEDLLARRLANQRLAAPRTADPVEVTRWLGAVQSQEYAQSLWALGLRTQGASAASVEAAIDRGAILRTWPMRGTIHLVPAEDARWMVQLLAGRPVRLARNTYRKIGLTDDVFARAADVVTGALRGGRQLPRKDLYALLTSAGIDCSASPNGGRGNHILGYLSHTGLLCIGPVRRGQPVFVLLDEWAPAPRQPAEPLAELAARYFTSHGPARIRDFSLVVRAHPGRCQAGHRAGRPGAGGRGARRRAVLGRARAAPARPPRPTGLTCCPRSTSTPWPTRTAACWPTAVRRSTAIC